MLLGMDEYPYHQITEQQDRTSHPGRRDVARSTKD